MKSTRLLSLVSAFVAVALTILLLTHSTEKAYAAVADATALPNPTPATDGSKTGKVTTSGGLTTVTLETNPGTVRVHLPDDIRAGDTISGTVVAEPKGQTSEEQAKNKAALNSYTLELRNPPVGKESTPLLNIKISAPLNNFTFTIPQFSDPASKPGGVNVVLMDQNSAVITESSWGFPRNPPGILSAWGSRHFFVGNADMTAQQGRPVEIFGPFDGNASNTTLRFGPPTSTVKDFEKGTENVSGGFGLIRPLAESPRKIVFESPNNVTGPVTILVKEGDGAPTTGTMRNVGVQLSAPKTSLMRGERTTLTVEVTGLEGIKEDVPLQLDSKGVINMDGGNFQNLRIKPQEITKDGRYTTTRAITGQQAGAFTVTATVIVRRFDFCLQDDTDPNRLFYLNSFTGDYIFACGGGSCRGGSIGGTQTGGTSTGQPTGAPQPPVTLTGTGKPTMKGCIITLSHNAPDRRVFARLDACTKTGDASVQTNSPKADIKITDKNTADNTAASPPK